MEGTHFEPGDIVRITGKQGMSWRVHKVDPDGVHVFGGPLRQWRVLPAESLHRATGAQRRAFLAAMEAEAPLRAAIRPRGKVRSR